MKPLKPLFMKTYGKESRKESAWILLENRKKAFDSSRSTDGDSSVFEAAQPPTKRERRTRAAGPETMRPAKKKAMQCLAEKSCAQENAPSPRRHSRSTRVKKMSVASGRAVRPAKLKALSCLKDANRDEGNISSGHLPSAGRFVTHRRRATTAKPPKSLFATLNSSDEFTARAVGPRRILRPTRRRAPPPLLALSSESAAGFDTGPLAEISLNELADHSLGPSPRKPAFCSTPSAGSISIRPRLKPPSYNDQSLSPLSVPVSCIGVSGTFHEDADMSGHLPALPVTPRSEEKLPPSLGEREPEPRGSQGSSGDPFLEPGSPKESGQCSVGNATTKNTAGSVSLSPLADGSYGSIRLALFIEALKEQCVTERCTVPLERLDCGAALLLRRQTSYYSCLDLSGGADSIEQPPVSRVSSSELRDIRSAGTSPSGAQPSTQETLEQSASVVYVGSSHRNGWGTDFAVGEPMSCDSALTPPAGPVNGERLSETAQLQNTGLSHANMSENGPEDVILLGEVTERRRTRGLRPKTASGPPETAGEAAALAMTLKEKCLTAKALVEVKRLSPSWRNNIEALERPESRHAETPVGVEKRLPTSSGDEIRGGEAAQGSRDIPKRGKKKRQSSAKEKKARRTTSADRPGTTRKACVSGLSVSRWKNNASVISSRAADCSLNHLVSTQGHNPEWLGGAVGFSTPGKASRLNLSSLLADLTPHTHTWSRLKAALSVHRRNKVLRTPCSLRPGAMGEFADVSGDLFATPFRTPRRPHLQPQLLGSDSPAACEDADLSDAEKVCAECGQPRPLPWEQCIAPGRMKQCVKIGEGTFGEVFSTTNASGDTVALKIIPLEGSVKVNGEDQKTFGEILHEIIISKELSSLKEKQQNKTHGFIGLNDLHCVQGRYPPHFLSAWDAFDQQKGSENDRPDFFETDQLFLILEFEFGGADLENSNGTLRSLAVAKSILHQVTAALAVAEEELHFEHRDLHWGNVLVKPTKEKTESFYLKGAAHSVETKGLLVRIIDYSLSRLEIDDLTVSCDIANDEELFMGQGDYQFDIYRLMRQENGNNWSDYHPHTNVLWLRYLCSKLLSMKYRGLGGRGFKALREELTRFHDDVLQYSSATDVLRTCPMFQ
ncbi:uncharacterized protein haspin [Pungitius pungitius]|uniref:uncharacterized protein haspin n=1 Tax=Pungitius pungitius TaxID=134920 RepID=UPI002E0D857F